MKEKVEQVFTSVDKVKENLNRYQQALDRTMSTMSDDDLLYNFIAVGPEMHKVPADKDYIKSELMRLVDYNPMLLLDSLLLQTGRELLRRCASGNN